MKSTELKFRGKMLADKRYAAACHEAAHAVICLRLNQTFKCIRLCEEAIGMQFGKAVTRLGQFLPTEETVLRDSAMTEAQVSLAGLVFEKLLRPHRSYTALCLFGGPMNDYKHAMEWCRYGLYGNDDSRQVEEFLFKNLLPPIRKQVFDDWNNIAAVGGLLAQSGDLSQAEVSAALN